jgi:hypothetical protein
VFDTNLKVLLSSEDKTRVLVWDCLVLILNLYGLGLLGANFKFICSGTSTVLGGIPVTGMLDKGSCICTGILNKN